MQMMEGIKDHKRRVYSSSRLIGLHSGPIENKGVSTAKITLSGWSNASSRANHMVQPVTTERLVSYSDDALITDLPTSLNCQCALANRQAVG